MVKQSIFAILVILTLNSFSFSQVIGVVKNSRNDKPIEGVSIFINRSTLATQSMADGSFELPAPPAGFVDILLVKNGFAHYKSSMRIESGKAYTLTLSLTPEKKSKSSSVSSIEDNLETGYRKLTYLKDREVLGIYLDYLSADNLDQTIQWEKKRKEIYTGSLRHFLRALATRSTKTEGFHISTSIDTMNLVQPTSIPGYYRFVHSGMFDVLFENSTNQIFTSRLMINGSFDFNDQGQLLNGKSIKVEGSMVDKLEEILPVDYTPISGDVEKALVETLSRFYEGVYVHTDKPYYYQGEPIWFKAYINYYYPVWRDSLSRVLYVELINSQKKIIMERVLKINNGSAHGDFILPDTLKGGDYYLRAYTNLQRNFGYENLGMKYIPVLNITDKLNSKLGNWDTLNNQVIRIESEKSSYSTREKIVLKITKKTLSNVRSSFSISVTDAQQVVPVNWDSITSIVSKKWPIETSKRGIDYLPERGIQIEGRCMNQDGKPVKTPFAIVDLKTRQMYTGSTNDNGEFALYDLDFYDSTTFNIKSFEKKERISKVTFENRKKPEIVINENKQKISNYLIATQSPQRLISEYEVPKGAILLDAVEVTANKQSFAREERSYGQVRDVDIIKEDDINTSYGDLNYSLVGKIPGLRLQQGPGGEWDVKIVRSSGLSINSGAEPLVTINDVPMSGSSAGAIISMVDPATVKSVEVSKGLNPLYGSQGVNGVIAIYTKDGSAITNQPNAEDITMVKLMGYSSPRIFTFPDHSVENNVIDFRSTLYWNPEIDI